MKKTSFLLLLVLVYPFSVNAQFEDSVSNQGRVFQLREVVILGSPNDSLNTISIQSIEKFNRIDISNALNVLPGISLANVGPRNESVVYVRGFDLRQVPVFIDGIPVYVPYDGYVDMGRYTTFDLSQINVSKGFSSILYGANTMGGAINLVSRRPVNKVDVNTRAGVFSGEGFRWNVNAGSNLGKYYLQVGVSQLKQNFYPLSNDFEALLYENGDEREHSYRNDFKFSVKAGFTPNDSDLHLLTDSTFIYNPEFTDQTIILAYQVDGSPLPKGEGPFRIVAPNDKRHARWIRELSTIKVIFSKE